MLLMIYFLTDAGGRVAFVGKLKPKLTLDASYIQV